MYLFRVPQITTYYFDLIELQTLLNTNKYYKIIEKIEFVCEKV